MMRRSPSSVADYAFPHLAAGWVVVLLLVLSSAGCAGMESTPPQKSPAAEAKPDGEAAVEPPPNHAAPKKRIATAPKSAASQDAPAAEPAPPVTTKPVEAEPVTRPGPPPATSPANEKAANSDIPAIKSPAKVAASPAPKEPAGKKAAAAPAADKPAAPPLDLDSLEKRLKETNAIGVFTKLTLKNQVDELLERFKAFYAGRTKTTLAELRQPYDLLILKVLTLLQDGDPSLAGAIRSSREAIWGILSDPVKFSKLAS